MEKAQTPFGLGCLDPNGLGPFRASGGLRRIWLAGSYVPLPIFSYRWIVSVYCLGSVLCIQDVWRTLIYIPVNDRVDAF